MPNVEKRQHVGTYTLTRSIRMNLDLFILDLDICARVAQKNINTTELICLLYY